MNQRTRRRVRIVILWVASRLEALSNRIRRAGYAIEADLFSPEFRIPVDQMDGAHIELRECYLPLQRDDFRVVHEKESMGAYCVWRDMMFCEQMVPHIIGHVWLRGFQSYQQKREQENGGASGSVSESTGDKT